MANGKIVWTAPQFWALSLDGAHFLTLDNAAVNMGTGDFGPDFIIKPDSAQADVEGLIVGKGAANLANNAGWQVFADKTNKRLVLKINDGQATVLTVYSNSDAFTLDSWSWGAARLDRDGQVTFYVNAVAVGGGSIAARAGSLNNAEPLKVGGLDASTNRFRGQLGMLRLDKGRILDAAWHAEEWDRLRFGLKPRPWENDFLAAWLFGQSLVDSLNGYTLVYNPETDTPAYDTGYPSGEISYTFAHNFNLDFEFAPLTTDSQQRAASGDLITAAAPYDKRYFRGQFEYLSHAQKAAIEAAEKSVKESGSFGFFIRGDRPRSMRCLAPEPTVFRQPLVYAHDTPFSGDVHWEET